MRHKASDKGGKFALWLLLCRHIGLLFGKRLDTDLLRHRIVKYPDLPVHALSDSLQIYFAQLESNEYFSSTVENYAAHFKSCKRRSVIN